MKFCIKKKLNLIALSVISLISCSTYAKNSQEAEVDALIREAMLYAYPYHEFLKMRHASLEVQGSATESKINKFRHSRNLASPKDRWANAPIRDTLYSTAWLDLDQTPVTIDLPDTDGRYYVIGMYGADINPFSHVGQRLSGTASRKVAVVGPKWNGVVHGVDQIVRSPTRDVYLNMRVLVKNDEDIKEANKIQDKFIITPLLNSEKNNPVNKPEEKSWKSFVNLANEAIKRNPPPNRESKILEKFSKVGICGEKCSWEKMDASLRDKWMKVAPNVEKNELKNRLNADRKVSLSDGVLNGWIPFRLPNGFGDDYLTRAGAAAMSGAMLGLEAAEAVYFFANVDENKKPLGNGNSYRLRLPSGKLPADAFWSIAIYEFSDGGQYMVENSINRYAISDRSQGLKFNSDGSLDIIVQPNDPGGDYHNNWLPSPKQNTFYLFARAYQPWPEVLDPSWTLEPVQKVSP